MTDTLDPRVNAFRPDLADERLKGQVEAAAFVTGVPATVSAPWLAARTAPDPAVSLGTEFLYGETVRVFERRDGWAWCQCETDGYVGYVATDGLGEAVSVPTHGVVVPGTFLYAEPDLRSPSRGRLSLGSRLVLGDEVETRGTLYRLVDGGGAVIAGHVAPVDQPVDGDAHVVAERFLNAPYLWGGRTSAGLDCSALMQLSLMATGIAAPRDSDQQEAELGNAVEGGVEGALHPGDLVFWRGHVGMMIDGEYMVHASGHQMMVVIEPLAEAAARMAATAGAPTSVRRL